MDILDIFNTRFMEFIDDITKVSPDIAKYKTIVSMVTGLDRTTVHRIFNEFVVTPFREHIVARDESFFLNESYDNVPNRDVNIIEHLKGIWGALGAGDKECVWKHLNLLVMLSERVHRTA